MRTTTWASWTMGTPTKTEQTLRVMREGTTAIRSNSGGDTKTGRGS